MKRLYFILIAIAFSLCIANPGCSDFAETDAVPPEGVEEGTVQSELFNGSLGLLNGSGSSYNTADTEANQEMAEILRRKKKRKRGMRL